MEEGNVKMKPEEENAPLEAILVSITALTAANFFIAQRMDREKYELQYTNCLKIAALFTMLCMFGVEITTLLAIF